MKEFLCRMAGDFFFRIILLALIIPSYFIVVWIFPGLEYHDPSSRRAPILVALIYAFGLLTAVAIAAIILFIVGAILIGAVMFLFRRNNA